MENQVISSGSNMKLPSRKIKLYPRLVLYDETRLIVEAEPSRVKGKDRDVLKGQGRSCDVNNYAVCVDKKIEGVTANLQKEYAGLVGAPPS